ncbi:MAG: RnfABCDGE type electron transport complex subunit D [Patescibacteria group bacterium]|nr:RnfABCDGE type electron transport complex subunit D [Patescibacteria group bacterium]
MLKPLFASSFAIVSYLAVSSALFLIFRRQIENFLNNITMYRVVLYGLIILLLGALLFSYLRILSFSPAALVFSTLALLAFNWLANFLCAKFLRLPVNAESVYITALILALIIPPPTLGLSSTLPFLIWASIWAQASKYILNINNKHLFNPAALAVALVALAMNQSANWWVGTASMLYLSWPIGLLIIKKVQRFDAILAFLIGAFGIIFTLGSSSPAAALYKTLVDAPLIFFASVMLTEPLTMPPTRDGRLAYGLLVGVLFAPETHIGKFDFTPELALLAGNVFSYIISPKQRLVLTLKSIKKAGEDIYDFVFNNPQSFKFRPGQYMELTLAHNKQDSRGNRRYFTLASSPTEADITLGIKFYQQPSSYKRALAKMRPGDKIVAGQLAGDFTLPHNRNKKLVFIAGGIGITPFRSMLKYLIDTNQRRTITLLYSCRNKNEIAYGDVLTQASALGMPTFCTLTDPNPPADWNGFSGYLDAQKIAAAVPDFRERYFYISGSNLMVRSVKATLRGMDVSPRRIITDFFPGLA